MSFGMDVTMRLSMLRQDHANGRELGDLACAWADMFQELCRKLCFRDTVTITRREYNQLLAASQGRTAADEPLYFSKYSVAIQAEPTRCRGYMANGDGEHRCSMFLGHLGEHVFR